MNGHENCNHSEVHHTIMRLAAETSLACMEAVLPMNLSGRMGVADAGMITATMIWAYALETGLRAGLLDPIGAQILVDHLDSTALDTYPESDAERAKLAVADDARQLLEATARLR